MILSSRFTHPRDQDPEVTLTMPEYEAPEKKSTRGYPKADRFLVPLAPTSSSGELNQFLPLAPWEPPAT